MSKEPISRCVYKADLEVTTHSSEEWLSDTVNTTIITLESDGIESLNTKIDSYIKDKTTISKGDFNINVDRIFIKVLRKYKSLEEEIKEPVLIDIINRLIEINIYESNSNDILETINLVVSKYKTTMEKFKEDIALWESNYGNTTYKFDYLMLSELSKEFWTNLGYSVELIAPTSITSLSMEVSVK